jgi:hypothetical protein
MLTVVQLMATVNSHPSRQDFIFILVPWSSFFGVSAVYRTYGSYQVVG